MLNIDLLPSARDIPSLSPSAAHEALVLDVYQLIFEAINLGNNFIEVEWLDGVEVSDDQVTYVVGVLNLKGFGTAVYHAVPSKEVMEDHPTDATEANWDEQAQPSTFVLKVTW
jgi:hypothetical protein